MPIPISQASLRTRIRTAVRQPNASGFISDAEINAYINEGAYRLYNLLVAARGEHYYATEWGFNTTIGVKRYPFPQNFYRLVSLMISETPGGSPSGTVQPTGATWYELKRMNPGDWALQESLTGDSIHDVRYALTGRQHETTTTQLAEIGLYPAPRAVWNVRTIYLPTLDLSNETSSSAPLYDGINGFDEYIVAHAAEQIAAMQEDSTVAVWRAKKADIEEQIRGLASDRDGHQPMQVRDVRWGRARRERYPRP